ncbi:unnamed protein product [Bubo scandiacus]
MNETAIENFVCVIFNVSFMNCTWHVDRTVSGDTQYFLYWKTSGKEDFTECQNYIKDDFERHRGCRFQNVMIENEKAYFLVNGSRSGQNIQLYEKKIKLYEIEKLTPPLNVTVNCTVASHCEIQWQPPCTSHVKRHACFKYEIVIENKADTEKNLKTTSKPERSITGNSYIFESFRAEKRYSVKIRATDNGCLVSTSWGEWSTPIEFGMNGSAIENFSCVIYNISLMKCTWQAGRDAPGDTQYFLYWQNSRDNDAMECELYIKDENGRNMGCRFQNVMIKTEKSYFLVNGSSKDSLIQFYDEYIQLYKIEMLTPPLNVTANCTRDSAGCIITWQPPLTSHMENVNCFQYEISIQKKDEPKEEKKDPPVRVRTYRYEFQNYNEKKKYILKIRASGKNCLVSSNWGEWSEPIEFGQGKDYFIFVILFLISLGTISVTLLQYCLFKRYCSFKSIFSPIPQPRDKFNASTDEDMQTEYVNLPKKSCTEEITIVEEMT